MPIMLAKTYAAFKAAGVSDAEAEAAAEEIAAFENRLTKIEGDLVHLKRMLGIVTGGVAGLYAVVGPGIWLLARIAAKIGALG
jgi:hypothetical protein